LQWNGGIKYHGNLEQYSTLESVGVVVNYHSIFITLGPVVNKYSSILTIEKGGTMINNRSIFITLAPGRRVRERLKTGEA
jgi:hypothetical protein